MIIDSKRTTYASVSLTRVGIVHVVSAFLLDGGEPNFDLGELFFRSELSADKARELFTQIVDQIETVEATGLLSDEMALRRLADYATRDRMGLVP